MTKKIVLLVSFFGTLFFATMWFGVENIWVDPFCLQRNFCEGFYNFLNQSAFLFFLFPIIFLGSIATYKMKDEVFLSWFRFSCWWIPITVFLTLITGEGSSGFGMGGILGPDVIAVVSSFLYFVISGATILERANRKI